MTNQEILTQAITKAEKSRWIWQRGYRIANKDTADHLIRTQNYKKLLTDHDFCKAFWGEKLICTNCLREYVRTDYYSKIPYKKRTCCSCAFDNQVAWQYHLQQMVITDNWLEYIEQFLGEK